MRKIGRMQGPGPGFYRRLRNVGVGFTAAGGAILTSPTVLPTGLVSLAGYVMITGMVTSIVCQALIKDGEDPDEGSTGAFVEPGPNPLLDPNR